MSPITKARQYLRHGPSHLLMYVFGRFTTVRKVVLWQHRLRDRCKSPNGIARTGEMRAVECVEPDVAADAVRKCGYFAGLRLLPGTVGSLCRFAMTSTCLANGDPRFPFLVGEKSQAEQVHQQRIRIGRFDHLTPNLPEVQNVSSDPTIVGIASNYLGCKPVFLGARIWWSFPAYADTDEQMSLGQGFHYDLDGYASIAFFFYLTDVDAAHGPHVVVRGSHSQKPLKALLSRYKGRRDSEIEKWYGRENHVVLCGEAGTGFAEDLFCFHRGLHPERGDRLIFQLRYGIRKYYAG